MCLSSKIANLIIDKSVFQIPTQTKLIKNFHVLMVSKITNGRIAECFRIHFDFLLRM